MARRPRIAPAGWVYHVLNRSAGRIRLFRSDADFQAFERILIEAHAKFPVRLYAWCIMSNHWHFVVEPTAEGQLTGFFRWVAHTHAMRWRVAHKAVGLGPLYQGRFKSFPIQQDGHFLTACRYVERNALSANLVDRAEDYRWGSLWARRQGAEGVQRLLADWPVDRPSGWVRVVNRPMGEDDVAQMETSIQRGRPLGTPQWVRQSASRLGMEHTLRSEGRPRKVMA